uniref:Ig-like domain-containing protein n=1 Tax=Glossina palpalis gambiensis TaxID=67801 RepID=A0A1B0B5T8_9MUSC
MRDSIILNCQADGTPTPEILWYKDANPVDPSPTVGIFNDGTELRISTIRHEDIGEYTCIARNGEGQVSHTARVIIAGGAVIMNLVLQANIACLSFRPASGNSQTIKTSSKTNKIYQITFFLAGVCQNRLNHY